MHMDETDVKILTELQSDARISMTDLAGRVSLTTTPCARRVQQLQTEGFIQGYVAVLDQAAIGLPVNAFIEVRLRREDQDEVTAFESAVRGYPEVIECWAMSGGYDYLLRVVTKDLDTYRIFLRSRLLNLKCLDHVETSFALERVLERANLPLDHLKIGG